MNLMKKLFWFSVLYLFPNLVSGQLISVDRMSSLDKLPSNSVQRIYQDKKGFLWFGTSDGLCRYDAYDILVFRSGMTNPNLLTNNEITCLTEDNKGRLFIGTKKGLNILDKETYRIAPLPNDEIIEQEIRTVMVAANGDIWVGTLTWVYRFNSDLTTYKKYDHELPITSVNSIYQDADNRIWVLLWGKGLHKYDPEQDAFTKQAVVGKNDNPFKFFRDDKNRYWLCTWGDGMFMFEPESEENPYRPMVIPSSDKQHKETIYFSITQDKKYGYLWLMSSSGIQVVACDDKDRLRLIDVSDAFNNFSNIFSEIICDKDGNLWIAAFGEGILTINPDKPVIESYEISPIKKQTGFSTNVMSVYEDKEGDLWIDQNRWGFGIFSPAQNEIRFFQEFLSLRNLSGMESISCIAGFTSLKDEVWLGPESVPVIYCVKKDRNQLSLYHQFDLAQITDNPGNPRLFFEDSKQNIWIATTTNLFVKPIGKKQMMLSDRSISDIRSITEDNRGDIWIATRNSGIYRIAFTDELQVGASAIVYFSKEKQDLISNHIESICADKQGDVWIGSKEGNVFVYRQKTNRFEDMSGTFELLKSGILNIVVDDLGHVWISTSKKIVEYNPENGGLMIYSASEESVVSSFIANSYYNNRSGKLFFGGNKGISVFTPYEKLSSKQRDIKAVVTDVKINNISVFEQNNNTRFNVGRQSVHFSPGDKNIEIHFSSLNYAFADKLKYAYKLEGIDDDWVYANYSRQLAFYNQLPKGKYTFLLKTTDVNGLWSEEITRIDVYKSPAFYETVWANIIYFILLSLFVYLVYRIVKNRINLRNELKIAQIEKEKGDEVTQTKLRYFTNISHDFLTPLTIINCLIDDAEMTLKNKMPQFGLMKSNINRLKKLLQQILDFRKVESGNMKLKIAQGDIALFIKEICLNNFEPLLNKKQILFSFYSESEQLPAYFDADKIDKILFNLLSNAFKYTPENGKIKVELKPYTQNDHAWISVIINDTGIGIAPENKDKIFTRFYSDKRGNAVETNGIGLSLTKDLLTLHHGFIEVESKLNEGTTFTFKIPIDRMSYDEKELNIPDRLIDDDHTDATNDWDAIQEKDLHADEIEKEDTHILLVEDNEELLHLMHHIFSKRRHVVMAKNGLEAIDVLKKNEIDIVISDVMMPEMDGLQLCRKLKADIETSHIPVILLTARNSAEDRIDCYNAGANGYISKPFDLKVLEARITNFLLNKNHKQNEFRLDSNINISILQTSSMDKKYLDKAIEIIKNNLLDTDFDVNRLAENLFVSKSSLYRKIKSITGLSPVEFVRNIRLKCAIQMLKEGICSISEVAYSSGFSSPKYFATCFKEEFNVTPSEYIKSISAKS
ncbi:MAG: response regulator [Dysgonamonadaceae bacterium]|nr:response regulator [Dysgonamonadaceae bacterium]